MPPGLDEPIRDVPSGSSPGPCVPFCALQAANTGSTSSTGVPAHAVCHVRRVLREGPEPAPRARAWAWVRPSGAPAIAQRPARLVPQPSSRARRVRRDGNEGQTGSRPGPPRVRCPACHRRRHRKATRPAPTLDEWKAGIRERRARRASPGSAWSDLGRRSRRRSWRTSVPASAPVATPAPSAATRAASKRTPRGPVP